MLLGNTFSEYINALVALCIAIGISLCLKYIVINKLKVLAERTKTRINDFIVALLTSIKLPFYIVISFYLATQFLVLHIALRKIIDAIFVIFVVYQVTRLVIIFLDYSFVNRTNEANGSSIEHMKDMIQFVIKVSLWVVGLLIILSNLGIDVTSLITGLGIGGIAVALAVQNILGDVFSYFAIYFDKPFVKGDMILIGAEIGIVERIGIKTTRIRALQGEEIVISNSELTSSRIRNFKKTEERHIVFTFGVVYETPLEKLQKLPRQVQDIVVGTERARFDRANLQSLGDSAYVFEVGYYAQSEDYDDYMDVHEAVLFQLIALCAQENIEFAFPTHTVNIVGSQIKDPGIQ